jgi:hypothetical protein
LTEVLPGIGAARRSLLSAIQLFEIRDDVGRLGHPSLAAIGARDAKDWNRCATTLRDELVPIALIEKDVAQLDVYPELIDCPADAPAEGAASELIERELVRFWSIGACMALDEVPRVEIRPRRVGRPALPLLLSGDQTVDNATPRELSREPGSQWLD